MIRLVALDMGGVLLRNQSRRQLAGGRLDFRGREALVHHFGRQGRRCDLDALAEHLFDPWAAEHDRRHKRGEEASWQPHLDRLRANTGVSGTDEEILGTWFRPYGEQLAAIDGARAALESLRALGLRTAVVSNVPLPGTLYRTVLEREGLADLLDDLLFSYDCGSRKPSPAMLRKALAFAGVAPQQAIMVGDRPAADVASGRAAGVRTVWVESEFKKGPSADASVTSIAQLGRLLDDWSP